MKCRRSAMPPMLHTRDAIQVEIVSMAVQCDLGRESLKFLMPRPSTPAPSSSPTSSKKKTGRTDAVAASGPPSASSAPSLPDASQRQTASPVVAPLSTPIASMEVDEEVAAPEEEAEVQDAAPTTPKRRRHRQRKRKRAAPSGSLPPDFDAREVIDIRNDQEQQRSDERLQELLDAGFPLTTPKRRGRSPRPSKWARRRFKKQEAKSEDAARSEALSSRRPSPHRYPLASRTVVTTTRSPTPSRPKSPSTTPGRPSSKAVKFSEPKPLPSALKSASSSSIRCHDVRLVDGDLEKDNVRIESAGVSPTPPVVVSSGKSGKKDKESRSKSAKKKPVAVFLQEDGTPVPIRAKPGWLSISNPPSAVVPKSSSSYPLVVQSLPAPMTLPSSSPSTSSSFDPVEMQKKLVEQQAYLDKFFATQQKWSSLMEKDIHKRTQELGVIADSLNLREKEVVAQARRLQGEKSASRSGPQLQPVVLMPRLEPVGTDYATSEPSSEWDEDSPSPPRQVP